MTKSDVADVKRHLHDPALTAGLLLLVGQLMRELGKTEVTMWPEDAEQDEAISVDDNGKRLIVRRIAEQDQ
jgi:hypothetical protein